MSDEKYTITQAASITGYEPHVIRYYEKEFNLDIPRNKSNHRYFTNKEIEKLNEIKKLQNRGFSNTQIKLILDSPKTILGIQDELSKTKSDKRSAITDGSLEKIKDDINKSIKKQLDLYNQQQQELLYSLVGQCKDLLEEIKVSINKDDDILLAENMKLKMKIKQKSYEVLELREQLQRERNKNNSVLNKIFGK
ncbi:MAG: MerR family transcriptional regulator [Clostridia bacterium]|nr:MerR family transcriptional regulator [Clostridia bacterium]